MKSKIKNKLVAFAKESVPSLATRSSFVGAEEAGMKGWRGRHRIPPKCEKAHFARVSRGLFGIILLAAGQGGNIRG